VALESIYPQMVELQTHLREDGKRVRYFTPSPGNIAAEESCPVSAIVFPRYEPDSDTRILPVGKVDALELIMENCNTLPKKLTCEKVGELVTWIKKIPCHALTMSSVAEAVTSVESIVG
jgi:hypothetical protein